MTCEAGWSAVPRAKNGAAGVLLSFIGHAARPYLLSPTYLCVLICYAPCICGMSLSAIPHGVSTCLAPHTCGHLHLLCPKRRAPYQARRLSYPLLLACPTLTSCCPVQSYPAVLPHADNRHYMLNLPQHHTAPYKPVPSPHPCPDLPFTSCPALYESFTS